MMTKEEAAAKLNGCEYGEEGDKDLWAEMKAAGLVAVFGASDDLMELRGALDDEFDVYGGGSAYISRGGRLPYCENECSHYKHAAEYATKIEANWDDGHGFAWTYAIEIPHSRFIVQEGDELYCEGIVFALADLPA